MRPLRHWPLEWLSIVAGLLLWQPAAMLFPSRLFPGPLAIAVELVDLALAGPLLADLGKTLMRVGIGFLAAMLLGTVLGLLVGRHRVVDRLLAPWLVLGLNLPAIVTAIALYIWLGLTEVALILAVVVNKLPLVTATLREGVRSFAPGSLRNWASTGCGTHPCLFCTWLVRVNSSSFSGRRRPAFSTTRPIAMRPITGGVKAKPLSM